MDIRGLQYFISAAECLNFTRAARECYITQTAMSLHIAKMEKELGFQLFSRKNHVVKLTPAGKDFYVRAQRIVRSYEEAVQHGLDTASGNETGASIIVPSVYEGLLIMPALHKYKKSHPGYRVAVRIVDLRAIPEALRQGEADLGICWPYDVVDDGTFETVDLLSGPCDAVVSTDNPLAEEEAVEATTLSNERVAVLEPQGMPSDYREMRSRFERGGFIFGSKTVAHNTEELFLMVASDEAVGVLPSYLSEFAPANVVFKPFAASEGEDLMATTSLIFAAGEINNTVRELADVIISHFKGYAHSIVNSGQGHDASAEDGE